MKYMILATMTVLALWLQMDFPMKEALFLTTMCWFTALCDTTLMGVLPFLIMRKIGYRPNEWMVPLIYIITLFTTYAVICAAHKLNNRQAGPGKE